MTAAPLRGGHSEPFRVVMESKKAQAENKYHTSEVWVPATYTFGIGLDPRRLTSETFNVESML